MAREQSGSSSGEEHDEDQRYMSPSAQWRVGGSGPRGAPPEYLEWGNLGGGASEMGGGASDVLLSNAVSKRGGRGIPESALEAYHTSGLFGVEPQWRSAVQKQVQVRPGHFFRVLTQRCDLRQLR